MGSLWSRISKVLPDDGAASDCFGSAVSIYDSTAMIGSFQDDEKGSDSGMYGGMFV